MTLQQILEIIAPLPFWVNCDNECRRYKDKSKCTVDGEVVYITTDGNGELTFEVEIN